MAFSFEFSFTKPYFAFCPNALNIDNFIRKLPHPVKQANVGNIDKMLATCFILPSSLMLPQLHGLLRNSKQKVLFRRIGLWQIRKYYKKPR